MTDLITRLEQAEAGSLELDLALIVAVYGIASTYPVPAYTTSLDAIVALIGEKLPGWMKGYQDDPKGARAYLSDPDSGRATSSLAKTPATAFCIALLRAIKEGEHG